MKKNILIIGASGHAKVIIDILERLNQYNIIGLVDTYKSKTERLFNYNILGTEHDIPQLIKKHNVFGGIIAIGDNYTRMKLAKAINDQHTNFKFITAIHPQAIIGKNVQIDEGTCVMAGAIINADACIGKHCIINTKSSVGHDCLIKCYNSIAPGATLGGNVHIDKCSSVSINATVIENISIGKHTVIGAAALVNKNIGNFKVAYGIPAKIIKERNKSDKYLGLILKTPLYKLEFHKIVDNKDLLNYYKTLQSIDPNNVFYSLEYCNTLPNKNISYFVLKEHEEPLIMMPIHLNPINENTEDISNVYYDACSPYGYSGPIYEMRNKDKLADFWESIDAWYKNNNVVTEFIRFNLNSNYKDYSGHLLSALNNIKGNLTIGFETIWNNFKQKVRNNYRKAQQNNLKAVFYHKNITDSHIKSFYDIYISTMVRNNATANYFYPKSYFENLIKNNKAHTVLVIVYHESTPISVELCLINNKALYSYLGGTLADYFNYRPNDFLKIETIKWAIKHDIYYYILGGGRKDGDGLYNYKKGFFPKDDDVAFMTGRKVVNQQKYLELIKGMDTEITEVDTLINDTTTYFPIYRIM